MAIAKYSHAPYTGRYRALLSVDCACRYFPVVAIDACPKVWCTRWIGALRSGVRDAWACLNQWGETPRSTPMRSAAARTTLKIAETSR
jgi:hypothetical protein